MSKAPDSDKAEDGGPSTVEQYLVKDPERFALNLSLIHISEPTRPY